MQMVEDRNKDRFENWQFCGFEKLPVCDHRAINARRIAFALPTRVLTSLFRHSSFRINFRWCWFWEYVRDGELVLLLLRAAQVLGTPNGLCLTVFCSSLHCSVVSTPVELQIRASVVLSAWEIRGAVQVELLIFDTMLMLWNLIGLLFCWHRYKCKTCVASKYISCNGQLTTLSFASATSNWAEADPKYRLLDLHLAPTLLLKTWRRQQACLSLETVYKIIYAVFGKLLPSPRFLTTWDTFLKVPWI